MPRWMIAMLVVIASPLAAQSALFEAARGAALTPGQWSYVRTVDGSEARFGTSFTIRCLRASRLVVLRRIDVVAPSALTITTDLSSRGVPASGTLGSTDPLLDAIAFSRGQFLVSGGSAQRLVLPASPEAARSIEDCRN
jgi:hypothetical protein